MNIGLNRKMNTKINKVFLTFNTKINETSKVDIILSPEFYWVRIFDIPVKTIKQAKDIIPGLWDDILTNSDQLSYKIIKLENNKYLCFAYINKIILEHFKLSNINLSLINNVYFAQNECIDYKEFCIDNSSFMYTDDKILIKVPNELLSNKIELKNVINNIKLSSHKVDIQFYNNSLEKRYIKILFVCFFVIFILNIMKYISYSLEISKLDTKIESIIKNNNLPSSMIQINSIINENSKIVQKELQKREALHYVLSNEKYKVASLVLDQNTLDVNFVNFDNYDIEKYISNKYKIEKVNVQENILNIRIIL